ncbi:MAG: cobalt ECF transporter T component CbiQ [Gammaproteobacteria bacterium]|jgi:cobalt/nickel transport system permease protein|nr:cobalt ECF transporter T component CbiQ [Gammaproteobacteria bacterium]
MALDIDRFANVASPVQRWDPRFKIAALMFLIVCIALLKTLPVAAVAFGIAALILLSTALPLHFVSHGLTFVVVFLLPFFVVMPLTYPGEPAFTIIGLPFAWEGLRIASLIFIKALSVVLISFAVFGSSRFDVSMLALQRLKCPPLIVQMLLFTYRYTFVFLDEMRRMYTSMRARGFVAHADRKTLHVFGNFVGTLLVHSFERTERVYKAMLSKGYQGQLHSMVTFRAIPGDYVKAAIALVIALALVITDASGVFAVAERGWF